MWVAGASAHKAFSGPIRLLPEGYKENITLEQIIQELDTLIGLWSKERSKNEAFGDFVIRKGIIKPVVNAAVDFWDATLIPTVNA